MTKSVYLPDIRVEVAFGSGFSTAAASRTWTDVTDYVEFDRSIGIQRGRGDELSDIDASQLTVVLNNRDGRFTAGLSSSPYYPNVKLMTPVRVRVAQNYLSANAASMETSVASWSAGGSVPPTLSQSSVRAYDGTKSLLITWGTGGSFPQANTTIGGLTIGQTYTVSSWFYAPAGNPGVRLVIPGGIATGASVTTTDQWALASVTFTATATSHAVQVWPTSTPTAGQQVWVDAVMVSDGSEPTAFTILDSSAATRFTGYVTRWPVEWNGTDADAWATVSASSRTARLGRSNPLSNVIYEEFRQDDPVAYYMLADTSEVRGRQDNLTSAGSGAAVAFEGTGPGTDGLSAAQFAGGQYLSSGDLGTTVVAVECFFSRNGAPSTNEVVAAAHNGTDWYALIINNAGQAASTKNGVFALGSGGNVADGATHHVYWDLVDGDVYVDGTLHSGSSLSLTGARTVTVGGWGDTSGSTAQLTGVVAHAAAYSSAISSTRRDEHAAVGLGTYVGESAADRLARYAAFAGVPVAEQSFDAAAVTPIAHIDTTGKAPVELFKLVSDAEGGQVFDARDGTLTYRSRNARYNAATGLTLNIATGMVEADVQPVYDDQALVNDSTATIPSGEETTVVGRVFDQDSIDAYGPYRQDLELHTTDSNDAAAAAGWLVNTHGEPATRIASLTTDVVQLDPATQADALEADIATRVAVTNWPTQVGSTYANGFFVEGYTETISPESWVITYNVSPADHYDVFTLDHADRGDLDSIYPLAW